MHSCSDDVCSDAKDEISDDGRTATRHIFVKIQSTIRYSTTTTLRFPRRRFKKFLLNEKMISGSGEVDQLRRCHSRSCQLHQDLKVALRPTGCKTTEIEIGVGMRRIEESLTLTSLADQEKVPPRM
ncbi:unnamed protein product [Protopolystoma xenopodis]|uniref:Uncharacterized protein n=1 Tax=Protopolystoma xenopodis TaxID=117903 RepID=A0A3S5AB44_9PLAT|nr:unnamed protein product [Protopolystoma xenopodis]